MFSVVLWRLAMYICSPSQQLWVQRMNTSSFHILDVICTGNEIHAHYSNCIRSFCLLINLGLQFFFLNVFLHSSQPGWQRWERQIWAWPSILPLNSVSNRWVYEMAFFLFWRHMNQQSFEILLAFFWHGLHLFYLILTT